VASSSSSAATLRRRSSTPPPTLSTSTSATAPATAAHQAVPARSSHHADPTQEASPEHPLRVQRSERLQRAAIFLVLLVGAALVLLGPIKSCVLDPGRADLVDMYRSQSHAFREEEGELDCDSRGDGRDSHHAAPPLQVGGSYLAEAVSAGISGVLMSLAVVLGGIGADIPGHHIFAMGTASLTGYSLSLGFNTFLIEAAKEEFSTSQLEEERMEVQSMPDDERGEMICHYQRRGLSAADAQTVASILSKYEDFWVEHMMHEELGIQLPRGASAATSAGTATFTALLFCGAIPLLGVVSSVALSHFRGPAWYRPQFATYIALSLSAATLLLLGVVVSRAAGSRTPILNGLLTLLNGCGTALLAFVFSQAGLSLYSTACEVKEASKVLSTADELKAGLSAAHTASPSSRSSSAAAAAAAAAAAVAAASAATPSSPSHLSEDNVKGVLAWPSFRNRFLRGMCGLWVIVCTCIVGMQLVKRLGYELLRVFLYGWLTCVTTGLGAVPFFFISIDAVSPLLLASANAAAGGMMLAASGHMVVEASEHSGPMGWQIIAGLLAGSVFIKWSERLHGGSGEDGEEEADVVALHSAFVERRHFRKAMLIFTVMFCHSAAEGIAVGVAFSRHLRSDFGFFVSLLLAVHNVPEGMAVALVLVPKGISPALASLIATLTSVPQPLLAVAAFLFVDTFTFLLPLGLAFAAGAMIYVCLSELLGEAVESLGWTRALVATSASFIGMCVLIVKLQELTGQ